MKQHRISILLILFLLNASLSFAQNTNRACQSDNRLKKDFQTNEKLRAEILLAEKAIKDFNVNSRAQNTHYTIPVIVHILYHTSAENIPDTQIVKMIDIMNQDFGRSNPDTVNTPLAFQSVASASPFEFCFARQDSLGNLSTGIEHIYTDTIQFSSPWSMQTHGVWPWNTDQYFNIWIGNATGFTYSNSTPVSIYPTYHANYGLMVSSSYVSQLQLGDTSQYSGREITHALGHCFNLRHLFSISTCVDEDSVADTPLQLDPTYSCLVFPLFDNCNANAPGVMFMNFMDINQESCMNMFTSGQASRMDASLNLFYPQLLSSNGCLWNAINKNEMEAVHVYPNPASGIFRVDCSHKNTVKYKVVDISGRLIEEKYISDVDFFEIDLNQFQRGIYFLSVSEQNGARHLAKLVKD